jgi:hypothetical protein
MLKTIFSWFTGSEEMNVEPLFCAREVWSYTHIDPKTKRTSTRPVLVFRKASDGMFWGLPLTKIKQNGKVMYVPRLRNGKRVSALSQMRTLKAGRLVHKLGTAGEREFATLNNSILRLLADTAPVKVKKARVAVAPARQRYERSVSPFAPIYVLQPR